MLDVAAWLDQVSILSALAFAVVALGGLTMGVAPSSLPMYSIVVGLVSGQANKQENTGVSQGLLLSSGFVLGMATVDATIGGLFGFLGSAVIRVLTDYLLYTNIVLAGVLVVFGLVLLRKIRIVIPVLSPSLRPAHSFTSAFVLGIPFGFAACPACTPMILPILGAAAVTGKVWLGAVLLFVFGLARGAPLLLAGTLAGTAVGSVDRFRRFAAWLPRIERASGWLLLLAAGYFLYQAAAFAGLATPFNFLFG